MYEIRIVVCWTEEEFAVKRGAVLDEIKKEKAAALAVMKNRRAEVGVQAAIEKAASQGNLLAGHCDGNVCLWNAGDGSLLYTLKSGAELSNAVAFSPEIWRANSWSFILQ